MVFQPFVTFIPPLYFLQTFDLRFCKTIFDNSGRHTAHDGIRRYIFRHHCPHGQYCAIAYRHTTFNHHIITNPHIIANNNAPTINPQKLCILIVVNKSFYGLASSTEKSRRCRYIFGRRMRSCYYSHIFSNACEIAYLRIVQIRVGTNICVSANVCISHQCATMHLIAATKTSAVVK